MDDTISRQAAIDALKNDMASIDHIIKGMSANDVRLDAYVSQRNQVNYDIYTINNLPPVQPEQLGTNLAEVGTDCISRQALLDKFEPWLKVKDYNDGELNMLKAILYEIRFMRSAEPKRGWWIEIINSRGVVVALRCSRCEKSPRHGVRSDFCPNCGADMREVTT